MTPDQQSPFMTRVRQSLMVRGEPVELPDDLSVARVIEPDTDLVDIFIKRIAEAKAEPHRVPDEAALVSRILEIVGEADATTAIVPAEEIPARQAIVSALESEGIRLLDPDDADAAFTADVGITGVAAAIAETASICLTSGQQRRRLASLAVPCHIGVVRAGQILADLLDWAEHQDSELPANQVLVSAPSKTADIELQLVMGVHGPRHEHIVIVG